jgi:hypothetical protein
MNNPQAYISPIKKFTYGQVPICIWTSYAVVDLALLSRLSAGRVVYYYAYLTNNQQPKPLNSLFAEASKFS